MQLRVGGITRAPTAAAIAASAPLGRSREYHQTASHSASCPCLALKAGSLTKVVNPHPGECN
jgi:hypothetical protein